MKTVQSWSLALALACAGMAAAPPADAFCGFYVAGADAELFNNATLVVMMRHGKKTVLSMQNNYEGPPEDFAMVVPVPVVLQKENVKTLPDSIFDRVDQLAAPRLVEYWEKDPCEPPRPPRVMMEGAGPPNEDRAFAKDGGVKVEAQFEVGEYQIVILSAGESTALDKWLRDNGYEIPNDAEPLLRPYVQRGSKFFVAKVDVEKVELEDGQAMLSPLRFHYDSDAFRLPVRLGLVNSAGTQDLIVHVLAEDRYEVANYENVTIPTNIDIDQGMKKQFGAFYAELFDRTLAKNPQAVVTEYAWDSGTCDPCPSPALDAQEIETLGGDVIESANPRGMVLTRLHARYGEDALGEDLVFEKAEPIAGGREHMSKDGKLEVGSVSAPRNNFQGRYAIRHPWTGPIECDDPKRGRWGGPPDGGEPPAEPALELAFAPRGKVKLASAVKHDVSEIGLEADKEVVDHPGAVPKAKEAAADEDAEKPAPTQTTEPESVKPSSNGCGACTMGPRPSRWGGLVAAIGLGAWLGRRRRRP